MKNDITIPILVNDLQEKDLVSAADHRKKYSLVRDQQAEDFNKAIEFGLMDLDTYDYRAETYANLTEGEKVLIDNF